MSKLFKWPPKEAQALPKAIQERFKARTKHELIHYLQVTDEFSGLTMTISFPTKQLMMDAKRALKKSSDPGKIESISKPKLGEGEYIPS